MYPYLELFNRQIPTYGICLLVAIVFVLLFSLKSAKKYGYTFYDLLIIGGFSLLVALPLGSVVYTVVSYDLNEIIAHIAEGNFNIFNGLVFYGALIGGIAGGIIGIRVANLDFVNAEKIIIPYIPIGHAIGRVGCVLAGCCYGMKYNGLFALYYPNSIAGAATEQGCFPVQILEAFLNIGICLLLLSVRNKVNRRFELLSVYLIFYGVIRFFIEFLRGDSIRGFYLNISTSQWISVIISFMGVIYLILPILVKGIRNINVKP